ncbi:MAG: DUF1667 domain-containing protein [Clostridia bacterium]|nr:DUF1667 domain-containing protein [Clostridia bacterium]
MNKKITCIVCPRGCEMEVTYDEKSVQKVENNFCKRGEAYAKEEILSPKRVVTSTVKVENGELAVLPVKTVRPVRKQHIFDIMKKIYTIDVNAPVKIGDVLYENIDGEGTDLVATSQTDVRR